MKTQTNDSYVEFVNTREVYLTRTLPATVERVWDYITDSDKRAKWFGGGPMNLRMGGSVEIHFDPSKLSPDEAGPDAGQSCSGANSAMTGNITQFEPPRLLSFTFNDSEIMFELTPVGNSTQLAITHAKLRSEEETIGVAAGWHTHMALLIAILGATERPRFWAMHGELKKTYTQRFEQRFEPASQH